ncbi:MAG TPA: S-layer homology domain-containing protein [Sedimentibacter sp.]|nr:S-layer homology domain-containing protein [Sedimentibacter sp.]
MVKKTFKRTVSLVLVLMMILSGTQVLFAVTTPQYNEGDIILEKKATPVEDKDNTYKIELSVTGKDIDSGKKVDVILVIDNSASMFNSKYNNKTLGEITRDAAKAFVDGVLTPENDESGNVRVAVVKYGEQAKARIFGTPDSWSSNWSNGLNLTDENVYTSNKTKANDAVEQATERTFSEGTNTEGGFLMAKKVAEAKRNDAMSIVIFMTDGMPTFRYTGTGSNTTNDYSGTNTSRNEFNWAIDAAQNLKTYIGDDGEIYTVALLNNVSKTSNQAKLAAKLLSLNPMKSKRSNNISSIMSDVIYDGLWDPNTAVYAERYYPIHAGDDAAAKMTEIYEGIAGTINALANGYVTDVIHKNFELTDDSKEYLEDQGVVITENDDGTTTLVFNNVKAYGEPNPLPVFEVKVKDGVYGTGYTNEKAFYTFTLFGETEESAPKYFEMPVVAINPTAKDDGYGIFQGQVLTVSIEQSILKNDETVKIEDGDYSVSNLVVKDEYVTTINTNKGGTAVVAADGTFVYTPPSGFTGDDTFVYKNKAVVTYTGIGADEFGLIGEYISNEATVTITVKPITGQTVQYTIRHLVQELNKELYVETGWGEVGDVITRSAMTFDGYVLAPDEPTEQQMILDTVGDNTITFWYVPAPINQVSYTVRYLDNVTEEPVAPEKTGYGNPEQEITEYAIDVPGYTPINEEETFVLYDENIVITFYYEKDFEGNVIIIKHYRQTGSNARNLVRTDAPIPVTTGGTIYGEDYKDSSLEVSRYKFKSSDPVSYDVVAEVPGDGPIQYVFELLYYRDSSGGGGGGGGGTVIEDPEIPLAELEKFDHFAYVIGYPEGDIRPMNNITREEVAMIFYRLLTDDSRNQLLSNTNPFTDVESGRWSNRAISTLYNADIISGYPDGTFRPSDSISRAEFATIAAKFDDLDLGNSSKFSDIFGHWAEKYITSAENKGWIKGYPDMTFKPEQDITRAEAMTLINNVLERAVPAENIHSDAMFWPDIDEDDWYFEAIMEATNSHDYVIEEDGDELWTGMKPNKVWP